MANVSKGNRGTTAKVLNKTAVYVGEGLRSFLEEAMPTSSSLISDAKSTVADVTSKFKSTSQSVSSSLKALKGQGALRAITDWYLGEDSSDLFSGDDLDFDIPTDDTSAEIAVAEISESKQNANQISSSVISSSAKMMEGNIQLTANILTSIDNQTSVITSGFDNLNHTLAKITEAIAANQDALIKATTANGAAIEGLNADSESKADATTSMLLGGKFDLKEYKKIISQNVTNDPTLGMAATFLPFLNKDTVKMFLSPDMFVKGGINLIADKIFPDLKKMMGSLDSMVNKEIMNLLIGLGDQANNDNLTGMLGKVFGIKSDRNIKAGEGRKSFEIKAIPFDTLTKEAITVTIPGYLQKILNAISGEDVVYDMRSRKFTTKEAQVEAYKDSMLRIGTKWNASDNIQNIFNGEYGSAFYDLMMADLGAKSGHYDFDTGTSQRKSQLDKFKDEGEFVKYAKDLLDRAGVQRDDTSDEWLQQTEDLIRESPHSTIRDISTQVAQENVRKNKHSSEYVNAAQLYQADLSGAKLDEEEELKRLAKNAGFKLSDESTQELKGVSSGGNILSGADYTNKALYEIYSILHRGINVFQVGKHNTQSKKFPDDQGDLDKHLKPPKNHKPIKSGAGVNGANEGSPLMAELMKGSSEDDPSLLTEAERDEDGNIIMEPDPDNPGKMRPKKLKGTQRFANWGRRTGSELKEAIFSGDPTKILAALGHSLRDVRELGQDALKTGAKKINTKYGNVLGSIKHKLTGAGYQYIDPITGETKIVGDTKVGTGKFDNEGNEIMKSGGAIGFVRDYLGKMLDPLKDKGKNWFQKVAKDFDFGGKGEKGDVKNKRKKFIMTSVGAMLGGGLLGGPLGLLMGGIAGNALSFGDVGSKIKEVLIGDGEDGRKKGLLTKLRDGIVDPIRFQFYKSAEFLGAKIRKNITGPLSDIGFAIKERITSAAKERFGKVFKVIGNIITAPFKGATKLLLAPIKLLTKGIPSLLGKVSRAGIGAATGVTGAGLGAIAKIIGGKGTRQRFDEDGNLIEEFSIADKLKERREARNKEIKDEWKITHGFKKRDKDGNYLDKDGNIVSSWWKAARNDEDDYKAWLNKENERRSQAKANFSKYIEEHPIEAETNEHVEQIEEDTGRIVEELSGSSQELVQNTAGLDVLIQRGLEKGSIYTHDIHTEEKLDEIIDILGGENPKPDRTETRQELDLGPDEDEPILESDTSQAIEGLKDTIAAGSIKQSITTAMQQGEMSTTETNIDDRVTNELTKNEPNSQVLKTASREMNRLQLNDREKEEEKEESIFDKIFGTLGNIWNSIGGIGGLGQLLAGGALIGGIIGLMNGSFGDVDFGDVLGKIHDVVGTIGTKVGNVWDRLFGDNNASASTNGMNIATGTVFDAVTDDPLASAMPGGEYYHINKDAAGNEIVNQDASNLKDEYLYINPLKQDIVKYTTSTEKAAFNNWRGEVALDKGAALENEIASLKNQIANTTDPDTLKSLNRQLKSKEKQLAKQTKKFDKYANTADDYAEAATTSSQQIKTGTIERMGKTAAGVALVAGEGELAGLAGEKIASSLGLDEEHSQAVGDLTGTLTSAGIMSHEMRAAVTGKSTVNQRIVNKVADITKQGLSDLGDDVGTIGSKIANSKAGTAVHGWIDDALKGVKDLLGKVLASLKDTAAYKKVAGTIGTKFDKITANIGKLFKNSKFLTKFTATAEKKAAAASAKAAASSIPIITVLSVGVFGLLGWADGIVGAAHLFGVRTVDVDDTMRTISSTMKAILGAASGFSVGSFVAIAIEALGVAMNAFGCDSLLTMIAVAIYNAVQGSERPMEVKKERFQKQIDLYKEKTGIELNSYEFNDMVNNADLLSWMMEGESAYDSDFNYELDAAGGIVKTGGIKGGHKQYYRDKNGQVVRDSSGQAVQLMDVKGHIIKQDYKWGDAIGDMIGDAGRGIVGGVTYETNDDGTAKLDSSGHAIVKSYDMGLFGHVANLFSGGAISKANAELERNAKLSAMNGYMPTDEDEENWKPQSGWPTAYELNQTLPEQYRNMDLPELYQSGYEIDFDGEKISAAKALAFASMNTRKCIQAGLWHEDDAGTVIKSPTTQTINRPADGTNIGGEIEGLSVNTEDEIITDDEGNQYRYNPSTGGYDAIESAEVSVPETPSQSLFTDIANSLNLDGVSGLLQNLGIATEGTTESVENISNQIAESGFKELVQAGLEEGSIYTHDQGAHDILTRIENGIASIYNDLHNGVEEEDKGIIKTSDKDTHSKLDSLSNSINTVISSLVDKINTAFSGIGTNIKIPAMPVTKRFGIGGETPTGVPNNIHINDDGTVAQDEAQAIDTNIQEGGNPLSVPSTLSLGYNGLWGDYYTPSHPHGGLDIIPADGSKSADITSRWEGKVTWVNKSVPGTDWNHNTAGNNVSILTTNPETGQEMTVRHMHMKYGSIPDNIKQGATVHVGDKIGELGSTGASSGPHLHYQMNLGNAPTASQSDSSRIDPTPYYTGQEGSQTLNAGSPASTPTPATDTSTDTSTNTETSSASDTSETGLAAIVNKIQEYGQEFLYKLTGGLVGKKRDEEPSSLDSSIVTSTTASSIQSSAETIMKIVKTEVGTTDDSYGLNKYNKWVYSGIGGLTKEMIDNFGGIGLTVKEVLDSLTPAQLQAYDKGGKQTLPADKQKMLSEAVENEKKAGTLTKVYSNNKQILDKTRFRTWNAAFVLWCLSKAGISHSKTDLTSEIVDWFNSEAKNKEWTVFECSAMTSSDNIQYGDILVLRSTECTGVGHGAPGYLMKTADGRIFDSRTEKVPYSYTIGFVDSEVKGKPGIYNVIIGCYRLNDGDPATVANVQMKLQGLTNATIYRAFEGEGVNSQVVETGNTAAVWAMLKELGYTDEQAAGIIGNIVRENGVRSRAIEGDIYGRKSGWDDSMYDTIVNDREKMDEYVQNGLFPFYKRNNVGIFKDAYRSPEDGHWYTGMGFVGFTGDETRKYLDWLNKQHSGRTWDDGVAQLAYMDERIRTKGAYAKLKKLFNEDRDAAGMARAFYTGYEMPGHSENHEWATKAAQYAVPIYNKHKGMVPDVPDKKLLTDAELEKLQNADIAMDGAAGGSRYGRGGEKDETMKIQSPAIGERPDDIIDERVGGELDSGNYTPATISREIRDNTVKVSPVNETNKRSSTPTYKPYTVSNNTNTTKETGTDLTKVIQSITILGNYLQAIANNTAIANEELSSLNEKDFGVDKQLRETIHAASKAKTHKEMPKFGKTNAMKGIINLAKP